MQNISIFWFRRDLRLEDNTALNQALLSGEQILPLFIFDDQIINELPVDDPRVNFIYESLSKVNEQLSFKNTSILCLRGNPIQVWEDLIASYSIKSVFVNKDYEPYARDRDQAVEKLLRANTIDLLAFKDQVIHQENDVLKKDGTPLNAGKITEITDTTAYDFIFTVVPLLAGERFASALTDMSLSNKVQKNFGKVRLVNYMKNS